MKHHMVDLETLDTSPAAVVLSIGIVGFDPVTFEVGEQYYAAVEIESQVHAGRTRSAATLEWWAKQSDEARAVFLETKQPVDDVLSDVANMLRDTGGLWGNGASFDNTILASLFRSFGHPQPWPFYLDRCFRTIKNTAVNAGYIEPARQGVHHNALDDAAHQVRVLKGACKHLSIKLETRA